MTVPIPAPVASFTWAPSGNPNEIVFTDTSTAQAGATYTYNFGGGIQVGGTNNSPVVTFPGGAGPYQVELTVTQGGQSDTFSTQVVVP